MPSETNGQTSATVGLPRVAERPLQGPTIPTAAMSLLRCLSPLSSAIIVPVMLHTKVSHSWQIEIEKQPSKFLYHLKLY